MVGHVAYERKIKDETGLDHGQFHFQDFTLFKCGPNRRNRSVLYSIYRYAVFWLVYTVEIFIS